MGQNHLLISGTGRAGTSFLVRFLTELGLDTTLSRQGDSAFWDENAEAGLEQMPFMSKELDLPYVVKSPAAAEMLRQIVSENNIKIDAIIVPIRDLTEAAMSRSVLELRAIYEHQPWRADSVDATIPTHGVVPGGALYSVHPLDQARILAVALHDLLLVAAQAEITVVFTSFPRLITDWEYLWRCIGSVLPGDISQSMAESAHLKVAAAAKVRIGSELASGADRSQTVPSAASELILADNIALRRELRRLRELKP